MCYNTGGRQNRIFTDCIKHKNYTKLGGKPMKKRCLALLLAGVLLLTACQPTYD